MHLPSPNITYQVCATRGLNKYANTKVTKPPKNENFIVTIHKDMA